MKKQLSIGVKVIILTLVMFISFAVASQLVGLDTSRAPSKAATADLLVVCFLNTMS
jgi:hypothetical protein